MSTSQSMLIIYGQLQASKVALESTRQRADLAPGCDEVAKKLEAVVEMLRLISRDLSKELGL